MNLVLGAILCFATGFLLVRILWPRRTNSLDAFLVQLSLGLNCGFGLFSVIFLLGRLTGFLHLVVIDLAAFTLVLLALLVLRKSQPSRSSRVRKKNQEGAQWFEQVLSLVFVLALGAALYGALMRTMAHPHGDGWDAFAIWNLHARFLFLGGQHWRDGFSQLIPWSHPDYPLLLPGAIAQFWTLIGNDTPVVPAVIGLVFIFTTIVLLTSAISILRGRIPALLAGITLAATPAFINVGAWQYADIPLSFFFLAVLALLCLQGEALPNSMPHSWRLLALAGLCLGFAAWTKNEGLFFCCAILLSLLLAPLRHGLFARSRLAKPIPFAAVLIAAAPVLIVVIYFKRVVAFPNEIFSAQGSLMNKILDWSRYWSILRWFVREFLRGGDWFLVPGTILMLGYYIVFRAKHEPTLSFSVCRFAICLMVAGYFGIYLITPYDLYWHLRFSLDRLFLQLWPSIIFLFFLSFPRPINTAAGEDPVQLV